MERKDPERADPITRVIASRVKQLRDQQRMSGAVLGAAVRDLGVSGWVDSTVGKLETKRRESVTVRELLALAVALDVPPVWLLTDLIGGTPVPIAEGHEVDSLTALLWLIGEQPLYGSGESGAWAGAHGTLRSFGTFARILEHWREIRKTAAERDELGIGEPSGARHRVYESMLDSIANHLEDLSTKGLPVPQVPPDVRTCAAEMGIALTGQKELKP